MEMNRKVIFFLVIPTYVWKKILRNISLQTNFRFDFLLITKRKLTVNFSYHNSLLISFCLKYFPFYCSIDLEIMNCSDSSSLNSSPMKKASHQANMSKLSLLSSAKQLKGCRITRRMKKMYDQGGNKVEKKCAICLSELGKNIAFLPCNHSFCLDCILTWWSSKSSCPFCREEFQFITDYYGKKLTFKDIPKKGLPKQEKTPKC